MGSRELTNEQVKAYIEAGGGSCPLCGHTGFHAGDVVIGDAEATQDVLCMNPECRIEWRDHYSLTDAELLA
jgi:hypothetical protein